MFNFCLSEHYSCGTLARCWFCKPAAVGSAESALLEATLSLSTRSRRYRAVPVLLGGNSVHGCRNDVWLLDSNIVIAKVDATDHENDTPAKVEGFPTLIFYPAGDEKNPITFEGDRSVEAMAAFIKEKRKSAPGGPKDNAADHQHEEL
jgi:hypothetical protein